MATQEKLNLTMLCDFYELTMSNGYFEKGYKDRIVYFDVFFRQCPDKGGFAIAAGLEQIVDYIQNLHIFAAGIFLVMHFWSIYQASALQAIYGLFRRELLYFQKNRL